MRRARIAAVLGDSGQLDGDALRSLGSRVEALELCADIAGGLDPVLLRRYFGGQLVYTLRSREQGGQFDGGHRERHACLWAAADHYDLVDLEAASDLTGP